jgi:serine/threonine protein phosphatase PrpC
LACDGRHAHLEIQEIQNLICADQSASDTAALLVRSADEAGSSDNCPVIVIQAKSD